MTSDTFAFVRPENADACLFALWNHAWDLELRDGMARPYPKGPDKELAERDLRDIDKVIQKLQPYLTAFLRLREPEQRDRGRWSSSLDDCDHAIAVKTLLFRRSRKPPCPRCRGYLCHVCRATWRRDLAQHVRDKDFVPVHVWNQDEQRVVVMPQQGPPDAGR